MCPNKECCHMEFFNADHEHFTKCPDCGEEMKQIGKPKRVSFEEEERRKRDLENTIQKAKNGVLNTPKCPTCGCGNIRKIGGLERGTSVLTLGLFSNKINKTFKCNQCGHTW